MLPFVATKSNVASTMLVACCFDIVAGVDGALAAIKRVVGDKFYNFYFARGSGCKALWWACLCMNSSCLSVCLSVREDISGSTRAIFTKFLVHVAYGRGSVLLRRRQCDEISREEAILGVFRGTVCYLGVTIPEGAILVIHVHNKPNTPMNCELDWSMQRRAQDRGRRLIASGGRVYYDRPRGEARLHNAGEVWYLRLPYYLFSRSVHQWIEGATVQLLQRKTVNFIYPDLWPTVFFICFFLILTLSMRYQTN